MRRKLIRWLSVACIVLMSFGFMLLGVGCGERYRLFGFTPAEEITVTQGDFVQVESMYVFDNHDDYYDVKYRILDSDEKQVETSGKGFFALDASDYRIVYTVVSTRGVYTKETTVKVKADDRNRLNVYVPETGTVNEPVEIVIENSLLQTYSFTVTVTCDGDVKTVENLTFTPTQIGEHEVTVTAVSAEETITQTYTVTVKEEMLEGTVEIFDESWSNKRGSWEVKTTAETGVKDRFGEDASYLFTESDVEYLNAYVSPQMDKKYYEKLAEQGYEYVSVWVYLDCRFAHTVQQSRGNGTFYQTAHKVLPKTWYEIRYNLKDDPKYDYRGSFLKGFNYFASQSQYLFLVDNSDMYNGVNGGRERDEQGNIVPFKVYIDDIYAVKAGEKIVIDDTVKPALKTGDTYDLKQFVQSDAKDELAYNVTYRNETTGAQGGSYTFTANGTYEISVGYGAAQPNRFGGVSFEVNVEPTHTATVDSLIREKTENSAEVNLDDLNFVLKDASGATVPDATYRYSVTKNGQSVSVNGGKFGADSVGRYGVEIEASYVNGGTTCKLYADAEVDVWDEASKYTVFDFDGNSRYFADSYYMNKGTWDIVPAPVVVNDAHGKTGKFAKVVITDQQQPIFGIKPMYSLNYYRRLLEDAGQEGAGAFTFSFDYFVEDATSASNAGKRTVAVFPGTKTRQTVDCGKWYTVSFSLEELVNGYYEQMTEGFDALDDLRGGASITILENENSEYYGCAFFYLANWNAYATNVYIGGGKIQKKAEQTPAEWLESVNGGKLVADYAKGDYAEEYAETGMSYFSRQNSQWPRASAAIVTETVGGVNGTYAKVVAATDSSYDQTISVYLPNTMDPDTLKAFAESGFVLKLNVFVDAPTVQVRDAYGLEYDESASAFKNIYESSHKFKITTGSWQEVEINLNDYVRLCEKLGSRYGQQIDTYTQGVIGISVRLSAVAAESWSLYFGELRVGLPAAEEIITAREGSTADLSQYLPDDGAAYELYREENGALAKFAGTSVTVGAEEVRFAVVKAEKYGRSIVKIIAVRPLTAPGAVTDYTKGGYVDIFNASNGMTYFQRNHSYWMHGDAEIVTGVIGERDGRYAKVRAAGGTDAGQTIPVYLPSTMEMAALKAYAGAGYTLRVRIYVDGDASSSVTVRTLEYDESASAFKNVWESSRESKISARSWQEVNIDINDYIRMCEALGNHYGEQVNHPTCTIGVVATSNTWDLYFGELYLVAPVE